MFKPFKPPLPRVAPAKVQTIDLTHISDSNSDSDVEAPRPSKKRKLLIHDMIPDSPPKKVQSSSAVNAPRKPLQVTNVNEPKPRQQEDVGPEGYYRVLWRKFQAKKHKTWDGDGILTVRGGYATLQDISGREMGRCMFNDALLPGSNLSIGGKDIEVDETISKEDFMAGRPFINGGRKKSSHAITDMSPRTTKKSISLPKGKVPLLGPKQATEESEAIPATSFYSAPRKTVAIGAQFKNPLLKTTIMPQKAGGAPTPRHDPEAEGAIVMKRPNDIPKGKQVVDVVIDPFLGHHLREHQREGVKFLYECVMGLRDFNGQGALLADEMGLGKTLQTIALIWTLLKQNPIYGSDGVIKKALIVCPVTLIANWKKEFQKWLGNERVGVLVVEDNKTKITDFTHGRSYNVMIIGYEKLRSVQDELKKGFGVDLVVADEGHRLKTSQNKAAMAIKSLNTARRIILSGTPLQNDLSEFWTMVEFINPGLLGSWNTFKKEFETPILKSRQPEASRNDKEKGLARQEELSSLTGMFILRRTAEILSKYLKPKTEYVVFCKPTQAQVEVYNHVLSSPFFGKVLGLAGSEASLQLITLLKKVCNAPSLLAGRDDAPPSNPNVVELLQAIPEELLRMAPVRASSKFRVLDSILRGLSQSTSEKIVIVSNFTATLDIIGKHLASLGLTFLRLDGKTPSATRQGLVDTFNKTSASKNFAFLLSAKSGGAGINLIGASRLILFDVEWNPAVDLQAMARIHRDGQMKPVKIYRFLMAGGLDEKIYQRQVTKMGLADEIVDGKKTESSFSAAELKDLFRLETANCQTHDLIGCDCEGCGREPPSLETLEGFRDEPLSDESEENLDSDDEVLARPKARLVPATKANVAAAQEAANAKVKRAKNAKGKMQYLLRYRHINTSVLQGNPLDTFGCEKDEVRDVKEALDDEILVNALVEGKSKVNFVFAKRG